jgi:regulator of sigma D
MSDTASILAVLGLALVGVSVYSAWRLTALSQAVRPLQTALPDRALVEQLTSLQKSLRESVDAQRTAVQELPRTISGVVSTEVRGGLDPARKEIASLAQESRSLSQALARSHDHLSQAVLTLNQDGTLGEWVGGFREAVEPLQSVSSAIERHYETAGQVLQTTSGLVEQWAAQREAVVQAFQKFSLTVERSAAAETTHLRDIENRLMNRLEEVAETNATVAKALSELQTAGRNALETSADLTSSVEKTRQQIAELLDLGRQTQTQHLELIRLQQQVQKDFGEWDRRTGQQMTELHNSIGQIARSSTEALNALHKGTQQAVNSLAALLQKLHESQTQAIQELHKAQEAAAARQDATARRQSEIVDQVRSLLAGLPTRRDQRLSLILLGSQVAATVFVIVAIYLR